MKPESIYYTKARTDKYNTRLVYLQPYIEVIMNTTGQINIRYDKQQYYKNTQSALYRQTRNY